MNQTQQQISKDQLPFENIELNEHIKDYLKWNNFQNTYECFEAEMNAQRMSSKLVNKKLITNPEKQKDAPRLYSYLKNEQAKTKREKDLYDNFVIVKQKYLQVLAAARHLFTLSVNLINEYAKTNEGQEEDNQDKILTFQRSILQYRKLVIYENDSPVLDSLTNNQVKEIKEKILNYQKENKRNELLNTMIQLRHSGLQCKYDQRQQFGSTLVQEDILELKKYENQGINQQNKEEFYIYQILNGHDFHVKKGCLAILSMYAAFDQGKKDLMEYDKENIILDMVIDILKNQEQGSVGQRFCLAILYKMSSLKDVIYYYHDKKLHLQMIDIIRNAQDIKTHNFCLDYASSILGNIVCEKFILESYVQDQKEAIKIMKALLELPSSKFGCGVNKNLLFVLAQFKSSQFHDLILETGYDDKINNFLTDVERNVTSAYEKQETLNYHAKIFVEAQQLEKSTQENNENQNENSLKDKEKENSKDNHKQEIEDVINYQNETLQEFILFEHFNDEVEKVYSVEDNNSKK